MALPNIELYEALKKDMSEETARMLAEVVPPASELATRADIQALEAKIDRLETKLFRWTLGFFMPLWVAVLAALVALVLQA